MLFNDGDVVINSIITERYKILIEMRPYFDDQEVLMAMDHDDLISAYNEMIFLKICLLPMKET